MMPGRDLDALVAEKVMGWEKCYGPRGGFLGWRRDEICTPRKTVRWAGYSRCADQVEDHMIRIKDWLYTLKHLRSGEWEASFHSQDMTRAFTSTNEDKDVAICLAALKAVGAEA